MGPKMRWNGVLFSLRRPTLKQLDLALVSLDLGLAVLEYLFPYINPPLHENNSLIFDLFFHAIFFVWVYLTPSIQRPLWQRRLYTLGSLGTTVLGLFWFHNYALILYWWILKGFFLLPFTDMCLIVGGVGIFHSMGWNAFDDKIFDEAIAQCSGFNLPPNYYCRQVDRSGSLFDDLIFYIGASAIASVGGHILKAEQASRQKSERLTQEIQTLTTQLERDRIGRDMHDAIGHQLTTLGVQLQLAQRLQTQAPHKAEQALQCATQLNHECLQSLRKILHQLQQDPINFAQSAQVLLQQMEQNTEVSVICSIDLPTLPPQMSHQLYCVVQEVLTNIQKHAQATQVNFKAWMSPDSLWLQIQDNGRGFDPEQSSSGFGLTGMQERILILGGRLAINSTPNQGTEVLIVIPAQGAS